MPLRKQSFAPNIVAATMTEISLSIPTSMYTRLREKAQSMGYKASLYAGMLLVAAWSVRIGVEENDSELADAIERFFPREPVKIPISGGMIDAAMAEATNALGDVANAIPRQIVRDMLKAALAAANGDPSHTPVAEKKARATTGRKTGKAIGRGKSKSTGRGLRPNMKTTVLDDGA